MTVSYLKHLTLFFSRFDPHDFSDKLKELAEELGQVKSTPLSITEEVRLVFKRNKVNSLTFSKCTWNRGESPRHGRSPSFIQWQRGTAKILTDFRPVTLTSLICIQG